MSQRMVLGAVGIAAITSLAGCGSSEYIQRNTVYDLDQAIAASGAGIRAPEKAQYTVIHFEFDKYTLTDEAMGNVAEQAAWIMENSNVRFSVTGHTDLVGNEDYNMKLSEQRGKEVMTYLSKLGADSSQVVLKSYGELSPIASNDTEEGRESNRRTECKILSM